MNEGRTNFWRGSSNLVKTLSHFKINTFHVWSNSIFFRPFSAHYFCEKRISGFFSCFFRANGKEFFLGHHIWFSVLGAQYMRVWGVEVVTVPNGVGCGGGDCTWWCGVSRWSLPGPGRPAVPPLWSDPQEQTAQKIVNAYRVVSVV